MKFKFWELISLAVLIALTVLFGLLKNVWSGFSYVSCAFMLCALIDFVVFRILYLLNLKKEYDDNLDIYLAELLNNGIITRREFEQKDPKALKAYYKTYNRTKKSITAICVLISIAVVVIILFLAKVL